MHRVDVGIVDADVRAAGDVDHHGAARHESSVVIDGDDAVGRPRTGKGWWIGNDNRSESISAARTDHVNQRHKPQPEKPLHSNSTEKIDVAEEPILYREPGRERSDGVIEPFRSEASSRGIGWPDELNCRCRDPIRRAQSVNA